MKAEIDDGLMIAVFQAQTKRGTKLTRRAFITMAYMLDTTPRVVVKRCEYLTLIKRGTWDWFEANGGITDKQINEVRATLDKVKS